MIWRILAGCFLVAACGGPDAPDPESLYFERLSALCNGEAYRGTLVSTDAEDEDFKSADIRMGPTRCEGAQVLIPFTIDEDRSRTWVITRTVDGLRLKHDHRHKDGHEDVITQYGGDSDASGAVGYQNFPADEATKALFIRENIEISTQNTWRVEIEPGTRFSYQMSRPERLFRLEFDLSAPIDAPPPSWREVPIE